MDDDAPRPQLAGLAHQVADIRSTRRLCLAMTTVLLLVLSSTACRSPSRSTAAPPTATAEVERDNPLEVPRPAATPDEKGRRTQRGTVEAEAPRKRREPSKRREARRPKAEPRYTERGIASWYGPGFHGRRTANGERFDMQDVTAAHKTLPFGTVVRVHNLDNGRTLDVRINDRGPFVHGRIIDLSKGAARKLDLVRAGVAKVEIEVLRWPEHLVGKTIDPSHRVVQVASFRDAARARALADELRRDPVLASVEVQRAKPWHRVRIVDVQLTRVNEVVQRLRRQGFAPLVLRP